MHNTVKDAYSPFYLEATSVQYHTPY